MRDKNFLQTIINDKNVFFNFMKEKFPVIFKSNIFLRDIQYSLEGYLIKKGYKLKMTELEKLTMDFCNYLEDKGELKKIGNNSWLVNFKTEENVVEV